MVHAAVCTKVAATYAVVAEPVVALAEIAKWRFVWFSHAIGLDYCNSALAGWRLTSARCAERCGSPSLRDGCTGPRQAYCSCIGSHQRVYFKLCCSVHSVFHDTGPTYVTNTVESPVPDVHAPVSGQRHRRSACSLPQLAPSWRTNALSHTPVAQRGTH